VVSSGETAQATVTNTYTPPPGPGSLEVTKTVNWGSATPTDKAFEITITGPSYPDGNTKTAYDDDVLTWNNLEPGTYQIDEANPGADWTKAISPSQVVVSSGETAQATVTNTYVGDREDDDEREKKKPTPTPTPTTPPLPTTSPEYFTVDFLGKITKEPISNSGRLMNSLEAPSPDGAHLFEMNKGTRTLDNEGNVVTLIRIREAAEVPALPGNIEVVGNAYDFKPSGIIFNKPTSLTLGYDINQLPENVTSITLAYYTTESGWIKLQAESGTVAEVGKLTAPVDHFTIFAVLAETNPAAFRLSNFTLTPSLSKFWRILTFAVRTGEDVNVTVEVTNHGGQYGTYIAILTVNGIDVGKKEISLGPGESQELVFTVSGNEPGRYVVQIGDMSGEFVSDSWINWWLILGLVAAFLGIGWLVRKYVF